MAALAFLVGFWSLAAQFALNRIVFFYLANSDFAAAAIVTVHLTGFLAGTLLAPRARLSLGGLLSGGTLATGMAAVLCWRVGAPVLGLGPTVALTVLFGVLLAATSGAALIKLLEQARAGGRERTVIIADSAGSAFGAAVAGFYLIPFAGLTASFGVVLTVQAATALLAAHRNEHTRRASIVAVVGAALASAGILALVHGGTARLEQPASAELPSRLVADGLTVDGPQGRLVFSEGSPFGLVSVVESPSETAMLLDSKLLCSTSDKPLEEHFQYRLGAKPAKLARFTANPRVAVIGLGCGFTLEGVLRNLPNPSTVEVIEINPVVVKAQKAFHGIVPKTANGERHVLRIGDGFRYFATRTGAPYDVVVMDVSWMHDMVSTHLFSVEMFSNIRRNMAPDGVLALHMEGAAPFAPSSRLVYRTLKAVFPYVYVDLADNVTFFHATARKDVINYMSPEGARVSAWMAELDDEGPLNTLDRLPLGRERWREMMRVVR